MSRAEIPTATDDEREQIRADIENWALVGGSQKSKQCLHIGSNGTALCACADVAGNVTESDRDKLTTKPLGVYPPGFHQLCRYCVKAWREGKYNG